MNWRRRGEEERRRERRKEEGREYIEGRTGEGEKEGYTSWFNNEWYIYDERISKTLSLKIYDNCRVRLGYYIRVGKVHTQVKATRGGRTALNFANYSRLSDLLWKATTETLKLFVVTGMSLAWVSDSHTPTL